MLTGPPKLLWCIQENSAPHFPLTCRRQGIKPLVLREFLYSYSSDKLTLLALVRPPFDLSESEGSEISISSEINTDAWGIYSGLLPLAFSKDKSLVDDPSQTSPAMMVWNIASSVLPLQASEIFFTGTGSKRFLFGKAKQ